MSSAVSPPLLDRFGRVHDYLRLSLVDKCNLRCTYCMPENIRFLAKSQLMSDAEILELAGIFVEMGVKKIRLTGGEPLLRKNAAEIIRGLAALPVELAITTNGILLHEFLDLFQEIGMRSINFSLDSFDPVRFAEITRRDLFAQVKQNMDAAVAAGLHVKVNMVVIRGFNEDEVVDFVSRTATERIHVRFIEFMPFDGNNWHWNQVYSYNEMLELISARYAIEKLQDKPNSTSKGYRVQGFAGTFSVISTITQPFCSTCNRIRLTAEGKLRNCLFAREERDLLEAMRAGKDVRSLIRASIQGKAEKLGGLPEFQNEKKLLEKLDGRAMVKIGG